MSPMLEPMVNEFREEVGTTKRVLDRVPADKLSWKPHAKSMSLGQLALHIASVPGNLTRILQLEEFDVSQASPEPPAPKSLQEIHSTFEQGVRDAENYLSALSDKTALGNWRLMAKGKHVFTKPRAGVIRSITLNHWYHHRGQLSVYLRMLEVPVPFIYGRSADENPFA